MVPVQDKTDAKTTATTSGLAYFICPPLSRVTFRRRYFTNRAARHRGLDAFPHFSNHERPHQGYRLRGRTPAALFWGAIAS
jgi:hypothetical protein